VEGAGEDGQERPRVAGCPSAPGTPVSSSLSWRCRDGLRRRHHTLRQPGLPSGVRPTGVDVSRRGLRQFRRPLAWLPTSNARPLDSSTLRRFSGLSEPPSVSVMPPLLRGSSRRRMTSVGNPRVCSLCRRTPSFHLMRQTCWRWPGTAVSRLSLIVSSSSCPASSSWMRIASWR
jgi:hypothetical protein